MLKIDWDGVAGLELGEESRSFCSNLSERRGWLDQGSIEGGGEEKVGLWVWIKDRDNQFINGLVMGGVRKKGVKDDFKVGWSSEEDVVVVN